MPGHLRGATLGQSQKTLQFCWPSCEKLSLADFISNSCICDRPLTDQAQASVGLVLVEAGVTDDVAQPTLPQPHWRLHLLQTHWALNAWATPQSGTSTFVVFDFVQLSGKLFPHVLHLCLDCGDLILETEQRIPFIVKRP